MSTIYWPDYQGGSIINLMSSIAKACGGKNLYKTLNNLNPLEIKNHKNIILVAIDGLGYDYLINKKNSFLFSKLKSSITSVGIPTTACAATSFLIGLPPQQTALTGWHMNLKELGAVTTILPFVPRAKGNFDKERINISKVLEEKGFFEKIKRKSLLIAHSDINKGEFNKYYCKKAKLIDANNINQFFKKLESAIKSKGKKYIYAYWPDFDSLSHEHGKESKRVEKHFKNLDRKFKKLYKKIKGTDSMVIITADHGSVSLPIKKRINLEDHPKLKECLTLPLCGDARTKYCYVHPSKTQQFEDYIKHNLNEFCEAYKTQDLIDKNLFGLGEPNKKLFNRLGDYILVMKDNNVMKDFVLGEKDNKHIGNHGGLSKEEMLVPLIILKSE